MAKRSSKRKNKGDDDRADHSNSIDKNNKDNEKVSSQSNQDSETPELWDAVEVVTKGNIPCRMEQCRENAVVVWASNLKPEDLWPMCEDCQLEQFGGWPDGMEPSNKSSQRLPSQDDIKGLCNSTDECCELPTVTPAKDPDDKGDTVMITSSSDNSDDSSESSNNSSGRETPLAVDNNPIVLQKEKESVSQDDVRNSSSQQNEVDDEVECEEVWDLKGILSMESINENPIKCSTEKCLLPAACYYVSNLKPLSKWYTCLDCQEGDFGGWPEPEELPVSSMTEEHMSLLATKCSKNCHAAMPRFQSSPSKKDPALTNTCPPGTQDAAASIVTPQPVKPKQPSKQALEMHRKWQEAAEAFGGPGTRIVVNKDEAKSIIFNKMYDAFCPMNITEIFKALQGVVPQPVLRTCLDDMAHNDASEDLFHNTDDDDDDHDNNNNSKRDDINRNVVLSSDSFSASLAFKSGKTANTCLYYVDYNKAKNGSGLDSDERNDLYAIASRAEAEEKDLKSRINEIQGESIRLQSEPTNEEAVIRLEAEESSLANLIEEVEEARKLKCNEKEKQQMRRRCEYFATCWRKRRRICMDFLISMEESSDGAISVKKCLSGDGQIDVEADDTVIQNALALAKKKHSKSSEGRKTNFIRKHGPSKSGNIFGIAPSEKFIGVVLDSQGRVERVLFDNLE